MWDMLFVFFCPPPPLSLFMSRTSWSLRTAPRADLVPDHATASSGRRSNFLPRDMFLNFCLSLNVFDQVVQNNQCGKVMKASLLLARNTEVILQARTLEWVAISFSNAWKWKVKVKLCPTLSNPMNCSPPGSSIHGIFHARVLELGAIAFSDVLTQFYWKVGRGK